MAVSVPSQYNYIETVLAVSTQTDFSNSTWKLDLFVFNFLLDSFADLT